MSFPFPALSPLSAENFQISGDPIGEGNFSTVMSAQCSLIEHPVAVKVVSKSKVERLKKELDVIMERHVLKRYGPKLDISI